MLSLHIEIGKIICHGTILAVNREQNEFRIVREISHSTNLLIKNKLKEYRPPPQLSAENTIDIAVSSILDSILSKKGIKKENIDYLTAHWNDYSKLKTLEDETELINKILDTTREKFNHSPKTYTPKTPKITANELKCEALKTGGKNLIESTANLIPPTVFLDFSTFSSGISINQNSKNDRLGLFSGLGMIILDFLARGLGDIDSNTGTFSQIPESEGEVYTNEVSDFISQITELISINRVPSGTPMVGNVPIDVKTSYEKEIRLIGCDVGTNGNKLKNIKNIGKKVASYGTATLKELLVRSFARFVGKTIRVMVLEELIHSESTICISTRNDLTSYWKKKLISTMKEIGFEKNVKNIYFLDNPASIGFTIQTLRAT